MLALYGEQSAILLNVYVSDHRVSLSKEDIGDFTNLVVIGQYLQPEVEHLGRRSH